MKRNVFGYTVSCAVAVGVAANPYKNADLYVEGPPALIVATATSTSSDYIISPVTGELFSLSRPYRGSVDYEKN
jgi:hypothetical protein